MDIVERLRAQWRYENDYDHPPEPLWKEAASEIERLRAELTEAWGERAQIVTWLRKNEARGNKGPIGVSAYAYGSIAGDIEAGIHKADRP